MGPYCKFCNNRCFMRVPATAPRRVLKAYGVCTLAATCANGKQFERERIGFCADDFKLHAEETPKITEAAAEAIATEVVKAEIDSINLARQRRAELEAEERTRIGNTPEDEVDEEE